MKETEILSELARIVDELSDEIERGELSMESDLVADAGLDSIDLIDLLCELGDRVGLELSTDDLEDLTEPTRVSCLVRYIGQRLHDAEAQHSSATMGAFTAPMGPDLETD